MHILHINLAKGFRGGERQTSLLINGLTEKFPEINQSLIVRQGSPLPDFIANKKIEIIYTKWPHLSSLLNSFANIDLVHAHEAKACHLAFLLSKTARLPYLITRRMDRPPKANRFTHAVYDNAETIVCLSSAINQIMQDYAPSVSSEVIPSMAASLAFSSNAISTIKNNVDKTQSKVLVGHIGALVKKHKGQQTIIEAARILEKTNPNIHFMLVGEGKDREALEQQALGLNNIEFVGFKSNIGDYLRTFDIFLFPSLQEGLGSTILDAMQAERPIIASNAGGIPDLITDKENGLLIPPENPDAIVEAIQQMLNDPESASEMAKNGAKKVKQYSPAVISQRYMHTYQQILKTT
jgi:glycosyltransferase involved in cell wall biosynthesis